MIERIRKCDGCGKKIGISYWILTQHNTIFPFTATYELCADCHSKVRDYLNDRNVFKGGVENESD